MNLNFEHLNYILAIEKYGSITKTAAALYISQPYLSKIVKDLEAQLGIVIFERTASGVNVTAEGRRFLQYVEEIFSSVNALMDFYSSGAGNTRSFKLSTIRSSIVMDAFMELQKKHRDERTQLHIKECSNQEVISDVASGHFDLGALQINELLRPLFSDILKSKGLEGRYTRHLGRNILVSKEHPLARQERKITPEDLKNYPLIQYGGMDAYLNGGDYIDLFTCIDKNTIQNVIYVYDRGSMISGLLESDCYTIGINQTRLQTQMHGICALPVDDDIMPRMGTFEMWLIYRRDREPDRYAEELIKLLEDGSEKDQKGPPPENS